MILYLIQQVYQQHICVNKMSDEIYKAVDDDITLMPQRLNLSRYAPVDAGYFPECYYLKFNLKND